MLTVTDGCLQVSQVCSREAKINFCGPLYHCSCSPLRHTRNHILRMLDIIIGYCRVQLKFDSISILIYFLKLRQLIVSLI